GGGDFDTFEIFSPPYLFKGARPNITAAPEGIAWGRKFKVFTVDAEKISKVALLKLGAPTHAFDQSQRIHDLAFTRRPGVLEITPPANDVEAPPGHFMLFVLNELGVPSVASIVQLGDKASDPAEEPIVENPPVLEPVRGTCGAPTPSGSVRALLPLLFGLGWMLRRWRGRRSTTAAARRLGSLP
ncbi:MAG: galactose oxidase early set domain-containing protein, partial [Myxococcaceae bacterium]